MFSFRDLSVGLLSALAIGLEGGVALGQNAEEPAKPVAPQEASITQGSIGDAVVINEGDATTMEGYRTWGDLSERKLFQSDHAFDDFVTPVSSPVFAKDPRSNTWARFLFINNWVPDSHAVIPGNEFQAYALQLNLAITERLSFIADKDGYAVVNQGPLKQGFLNLGAGLKYAFIRRPEDQLIVSGGFMYEIPSGEKDVLQGYGAGVMTPFVTGGKGWGNFHTITNMALSVPLNNTMNSGFFFWQQHFDYNVTDWFAPIGEVNWYHYTSGGNHGLPYAVGEGDGLLNLGTSGMTGADLVTIALGGRIKLTNGLSTGIVWETPISNRKDLIQNRINLDVIFRY
ncbi:hypothetical protein K2Y11_01085 [bacterium]|nr:hypothetical protein [bacterium]